MTAQSTLKDYGSAALGLALVVGVAALGMAMLYGAAEASVWALNWAPEISGWALWVCALILFPLSLIPSTRGFAGNGLYLASYIFAFILWIVAMAFTYSEWGFIALIIGLVFFGGGVIPMSIIAAIFGGEWGALGSIALLMLFALATRFFGVWLIEKAADRSIQLAEEKAIKERVVPAHRIEQDAS